MITGVGCSVVLGLQGAQMPANAIRGIGRWTEEYVLSLVHEFPELVAAVSIDPRLPIPKVVHALPAEIEVMFTDERPGPRGGTLLFHAFSLLEDLPLERLWPRWAQGNNVGLVATMFDLIPLRYPSDYLQGSLGELLRGRYQLIEQAQQIVTISASAAADLQTYLQVPRDRVTLVPAAVNRRFIPHAQGREGALRELPAPLGLREGFILSVGNVDPRKNLERLFRAYAILPPSLRRRHQLVVTCSQADESQLALLQGRAEAVGAGNDLILLSFVDDSVMTALYQSCHAMIFPSLFEGLGLPVLEAMACGAAVVVSDRPAMNDLVSDPDARFDPTDVASMSEALRRLMTDPAHVRRRRLGGVSTVRASTSPTSAGAAVSAYQRAAAMP